MTGEKINMSFTFVYETFLPTNAQEVQDFISEAKEQLESFTATIDEKVRETLLTAAEKYQAGEYTREGNVVRISFEEERLRLESKAVQA